MRTALIGKVCRPAVAILCALLAGCGTLGFIKDRAETINKLTASYSGAAIFYNILRAKNAEPLNFATLTGVTGHDTANIGIGLPTIVFGPHASPRSYAFGPNTIAASSSDDFVVNVINDPASYAALSRPADPATIGYFMNQLFINRDQLFFLFVSKLRRVDASGHLIGDYYNEPYVFNEDEGKYGLYADFIGGFFERMNYYIKNGLVIYVDQTYFPSAKTTDARFCFEGRPDIPSAAIAPSTCPTNPFVWDKAAADSKTTKRSVSEKGDGVKGGVSIEGKVSVGGQVQISTSSPSGATTAEWYFDDPSPDNKGGKVYVYTRSVFAMYRYLGEIANLRELGELDPQRHRALEYSGSIFAGSPQTEILHITHDESGCWANVEYEDKQWCVPNYALATKRTFAILHQLFQLYASPNSQPATPTVRITPG